jgi:WD40 repeat protein
MGLTCAALLFTLAAADIPAPADESPFLIPSARAGNSDLFLMYPAKGDAKNLTKSEQADELYPAWSPGGKRIAFVCKTLDHNFEVYVCDADGSHRKRLTTADSPSACFTPSWSADGQRIVYLRLPSNGTNRGEVRVVDVEGKADRVVAVDATGPAWSPDGKSIAFVRKTAGKPAALCRINPDGTNETVLTDELGPDAPVFPAWSPNGKWIAISITTDYGWQIALAPAAGGSPRQLTHLPGFNINPVWIDADRLLFAHTAQPGASNGGYVSIKIDGTRLAIHALTKCEPPHAIGRPAFYVPPMLQKPNRDANHVKLAAFVEPGTTKKAAIKAAPVAVLPPAVPGAVASAAWAPDGKRLAFSLEAGLIIVAEFDGKAVRPLEVFRGHEGPVEGLAFAADGMNIFSAGSDKTVRTWELGTKGATSVEADHEAGIDALARSGTGKLLATGDRDGKVKIRDAATARPEREIAVCNAKRGAIHALAFNKNDSMLFAGCAKWGMPVLNGAVAAFDPSNGRELWRTKGTMGGVFALALAPDGTKLAGACLDSFVRIWDAKTGKELACWKGHADRVTGVAWALDGKVLVSCGFDHTVRVWDAGGTLLQTLVAHAGPVIRVTAAADGKHVVSTGQAGAVCIWKLTESGY